MYVLLLAISYRKSTRCIDLLTKIYATWFSGSQTVQQALMHADGQIPLSSTSRQVLGQVLLTLLIYKPNDTAPSKFSPV